MKATVYFFKTDNDHGDTVRLFTSSGDLCAAIHDCVESYDSKLADTMSGYEFESEAWEESWELFKEEQTARCHYYSFGEQELVFAQEASTPRTSNRHPALPGMLVMQVPTMSTLHITKEDGARLAEFESEAVLAEISGGTGHIVDFPDASTIEEDFRDYSEAFRRILHTLAVLGFTYVRFDGDHAICASFPTFEW